MSKYQVLARRSGTAAPTSFHLNRLKKLTPQKVVSRLVRLVRQQNRPISNVPRPILDSLTAEMLQLNEVAARGEGVESAVHCKDFIYWFCVTHPGMSVPQGIDYYFQDGARSAAKLAAVVADLELKKERPLKLLEFASGYGCVSRRLKKNTQFDLLSCDIHSAATGFVSEKLGVRTMLSVPVPERFAPAEKFDAVFALSFFSHMPKSTFGRWLKALYSALDTPGYLIFTTHGIESCVGLEITTDDIPSDGFWLAAQSEQKDLNSEEYGLSLTTPDFVIGEIYRQLGAPVAAYKYAHWWNHQDLWIVKREK